MKPLAERLTEANAKLVDEQYTLSKAKYEVMQAREQLKNAETALILAGLEGKNAEIRNAMLAQQTERERVILQAAEQTLLTAEASFAIARLQWRLACELNQLVVAQQAVRVET
jgi:hypothetical protein